MSRHDDDPPSREAAQGSALHEMNPLGRFSERAADYVLYRPDYPAAAIDCALRDIVEPERRVIADIGAGTGISARMIGDRGARVMAIEPNATMREAALPHPNVEFRSGTAESTGLDSGSIDLVLAAQAFHWFRAPEALSEFHRILRPGGRLILMWNHRDRSDELTRGYVEAIHAVNGEHPAERATFDPAVLEQSGLFTAAVLESFPHVQVLDRDGLVGRATSASYVPRGGPGFERLRHSLLELFDRLKDQAGTVRMRYVTQVYRAERR
jgi:SAM-dependent methyltransferase